MWTVGFRATAQRPMSIVIHTSKAHSHVSLPSCVTNCLLNMHHKSSVAYPNSVIPILVNTTHAPHAYLIYYSLATHRNESFFFIKKKSLGQNRSIGEALSRAYKM